ncbi:MAG: alpha/beta fold hydrolase [Labilithrix sp.]|nr:alpha/beta fold hydrolase [Labilithrix sp.]
MKPLASPRVLAAGSPALLALVVAACAAACADPSSSSSSSGDPPPPSAEETPDAGPEPVSWATCSLHTEGGPPAAECATVKLPLRAEDPAGETIDVFVKRYRPAGGKARRALWMLQGGPGGSGYAFEGMAKAIATRYPDVEFYIPDHRGTGRSTKLTCAAQAPDSEGGIGISSSEWAACLAENQERWGEKLAAFSTTNAANDVGLLIERTRREGQPVFLYGGSYGTYWANRYLQLYPDQADGVVMDSIAAPGTSLARQDEDANEAARELLALCAKDTKCADKLGPDPWAKALGLVTELAAGHCSEVEPPPGFTTSLAVRLAFGTMLMQPHLRGYVPAAIYRLDRCAPNDLTALGAFFKALYGGGGGGGASEMLKGWGFVLSNNVAFSEMWETPPPSSEALASIREAAVASREITAGLPELYETWPRYVEPRAGTWAETETPILMLAGGLDPATLFRKQLPARDHFRGAHQHFVGIPSATHTVIASSATTANRSCGTMIMMSFLEDPRGTPDTSCLADVVPLSFDGDPATTSALFGTDDAWE